MPYLYPFISLLIVSIPFAIAYFVARSIYRRIINSNNDSGAMLWSVLAYLGILAVTGTIALVVLAAISGIQC